MIRKHSKSYKFETPWGLLNVHISGDKNKPSRIFLHLDPIGSEQAGLVGLIGALLTETLDAGVGPEILIKHLNSICGHKVMYLDGKAIDSIPKAVALAIQNYMEAYGTTGTTT